MKVLVVSDSHGHIANLRLALDFGKRVGVKAIIHCGDWNNIKAIEEIKKENIPLYGVLGNADIDPEMEKYFSEEFLKINLGGRNIGIIHNLKKLKSEIKDLDILFCGHVHSKFEGTVKEIKVVRPGAIHSDKPTSVIYDTITNKVNFFDL